ncbi:MAG: tRNA (N6-threonylcarbamoyladenosine(37)-N6)-methyltransferase TrmO [Candidatus Cryptobacteroides sp.]
MQIEPVAYFRSPFPTKFGIPRQAGLAPDLEGRIVFEPKYRNADALRGLEDFDYIWLIWEFSAVRNCGEEDFQPTVRPPRLGGNERVGVFSSRSPFRPNRLGLSSARIERIEFNALDKDGQQIGPVIHVLGADLMDGTPIFDIKPYVTYTDSHPGAKSGFVDAKTWKTLEVNIPEGLCPKDLDIKVLKEVLAQDPRPAYKTDPDRVYGMAFGTYDIRFRVRDGVLEVVGIAKS